MSPMFKNSGTCFILFFMLLAYTAQGQQKLERETTIKKELVPAQALQFIEGVKDKKRLKWYFEENLEGASVEAKFKAEGSKYSIEFDTAGYIEDVEVVRKMRQMPVPVLKSICTTLDTIFTRHRIGKIQQQFTGSRQALLQVANRQQVPPEVVVRYEVVVKGKKDKAARLYEMTFNDTGKLLNTRQIIFKNTDNLEY